MEEYLIDIWIVVGIVVAINLLILLANSDNRFWKTPILIWGLILSTFFVATNIQNTQVEHLDNQYWKSAEGKSYGDTEIWRELKESRKQEVKLRMTLLHFLGLQTIATFILQIFGYRKTEKKKLYGWTTIIFGTLTILYLIFQTLVEIVPTGPFF